MTSSALLELPAIKWSYRYKPPNSNIQYQVTNTCPLDTNLQMIIYYVVEKYSLLLEALNSIRKGDFDKARHDVLSERIFHDLLLDLRKRVVKNENIEKWNCWGDWTDYHFQYYFRQMEEGS